MSRIAVLNSLAGGGELAAAVDDLAAHLERCGLTVVAWPAPADAVLVWSDRADAETTADLLQRADAGTPVLLAGPTAASWAEVDGVLDAAGLVPGPLTPTHELRLRPGGISPVTTRMPAEVLVRDRWLAIDKARDDVEVLLTAMSGLTLHPVMTWRPATRIGTLTTGWSPESLRDQEFRRLAHRWIRHALGQPDAAAVRVGMLGYGAIGAEHAEAFAAVDGLSLAAVCDKSAQRIAAARIDNPDLAAYDDADDLLASDVDLIVVSTPPNTHADWALRALAAGKHVVVEKPFCITTAEADELIDAAAGAGRALAVYQNRRWDADYLAVKRVVRSGLIGEVFHYESFVGDYGHPCNYWHSDEEVSGGAVYDWGSHYLDWALDLFQQPIDHVTAATHKRRWHDVTNADHTRVSIRFSDGVEAEFIHSDLAAAMKPKWYVLGTEGALVGQWRRERVVGRNAVGNLVEDRLTAAESPADLSVFAPDGSVTSVALAPPPRYPFHRELADLLLSGAPMSITPAGSRRNIAVMEAATASARDGGRPVQPR
jgi:predicted dehydrogenase